MKTIYALNVVLWLHTDPRAAAFEAISTEELYCKNSEISKASRKQRTGCIIGGIWGWRDRGKGNHTRA